jgi:hypothetical protein
METVGSNPTPRLRQETGAQAQPENDLWKRRQPFPRYGPVVSCGRHFKIESGCFQQREMKGKNEY